MTTVELPQDLRIAIYQISQDVACDMDPEHGSDAEMVAEGVLGVLEIYRPELWPELIKLVDAHGYTAVHTAAVKVVGTL